MPIGAVCKPRMLNMAGPINWLAPLNRGLVGHWLYVPGLTGGKSLVDLCAYHNSGTLVNTPTWSTAIQRPGGLGMLKFVAANDQYVDLGNPKPLQITGPITIACWYYLTTIPASGSDFQLVAKDADTGGRAYTFDIRTDATLVSSSGVRFYINGGAAANLAIEGRTPVAGDLRHAVGTYHATTIRVYVNGVAGGTSSSSADASIPTATTNVLIGRRGYAGFTEPINGHIDDVRIYNRALSAMEVVELYRASRLGYPNELNWLDLGRWAPQAAPSGDLLLRMQTEGLFTGGFAA